MVVASVAEYAGERPDRASTGAALLFDGLSVAATAKRLHVSPHTIVDHLKKIPETGCAEQGSVADQAGSRSVRITPSGNFWGDFAWRNTRGEQSR